MVDVHDIKPDQSPIYGMFHGAISAMGRLGWDWAIQETCIWASMRLQTLWRTVAGICKQLGGAQDAGRIGGAP